MSSQFKTSLPQPKLDLLICSDHINQDVVLVSTLVPITLDLFGTNPSSPRLDFLDNFSKKKQQKRSLDGPSNCKETMNKNNKNIPWLDLKLNLSPPSSSRVSTGPESRSQSTSVSPTNSCVSSSDTSSPAEATTMILVGCPRCLMYVMLSQDDPKCPKCNNTVLIDFLHNNHKNDENNTVSLKKCRKS
ncbi:hypothetical protein vseg_010903 [Gypsophila vaccaria]